MSNNMFPPSRRPQASKVVGTIVAYIFAAGIVVVVLLGLSWLIITLWSAVF